MAINCAYACGYKNAYGVCNMSVCQLYLDNIKIARTMLEYDNLDKQQFIDEAGRYFSSPEVLCKKCKINYKMFMAKVNTGMSWVDALAQCTFEQATMPKGGLEYNNGFDSEKAKQRGELADSYFGMTNNQYTKNNNGFGFGE